VSTIKRQEIKLKNGASAVARNASVADAYSVVEIMRTVANEHDYTVAEPDEVNWTEHGKREDIQEHRDKPGYLTLVAEVGGCVVGFLEFENGQRRRTQHSGMFSIFILKEWRTVGIGSALISVLLEWATANPLIEKVTLATFSTNTPALALYKKLGFQEEGRCPHDMKVGAAYIDSVLMYKFVK
jgi:RimJ/RimL family protein N-acetyltransferase